MSASSFSHMDAWLLIQDPVLREQMKREFLLSLLDLLDKDKEPRLVWAKKEAKEAGGKVTFELKCLHSLDPPLTEKDCENIKSFMQRKRMPVAVADETGVNYVILAIPLV